MICGFLLRPKHVRLYRIKYYPGYFITQNNIIFDISEENVRFSTPQNQDIVKQSYFRTILRCEYHGRVFYSIEANVFGTQEKTAYQNKFSSQSKKIKKYIIFWTRSERNHQFRLQKSRCDLGSVSHPTQTEHDIVLHWSLSSQASTVY